MMERDQNEIPIQIPTYTPKIMGQDSHWHSLDHRSIHRNNPMVCLCSKISNRDNQPTINTRIHFNISRYLHWSYPLRLRIGRIDPEIQRMERIFRMRLEIVINGKSERQWNFHDQEQLPIILKELTDFIASKIVKVDLPTQFQWIDNKYE